MESILHIEPIVRNVTTPLSVGHTDYIFYGDKPEECDEDDLGAPAAHMRLGSPLESVDYGSTNTQVPLIKTIEYMADPERRSGHVFMETIHYFQDTKYLIPIRTKIHSGSSAGLRIAHLPSLNHARIALSGCGVRIEDIRSEIVSELLAKDAHFLKHPRHPINDWIQNDLTNFLNTSTVTDIRFDTQRLAWMIGDYLDEIKRTPHDLNAHHLNRITGRIGIEHETFPMSYFSKDVIARPLMDFKRSMVASSHNFRSFGRIPIEKIPNLEINPIAFQSALGVIDRLPLTDCNVDVIVRIDNSIAYVHENIAVNRFSVFADSEVGRFSSESLLSDIINESTLKSILEKFSNHHSKVTDDVRDLINTEPVKLKIMKTINDEALILLYRYNSDDKQEPLCGVYFDIALQSLAPLTIIPESIVY